MKQMRIPIIIVLALGLIGVIVGSFLDLSVSSSIAKSSNNFAIGVSIAAPTLGYLFFAVAGGGLFAVGLRKEMKVWQRVILIVLAVAMVFGPAIAGTGTEFFGPNGFVGAAPTWVGYVLACVILAAGGVGGYFLFRNNDNPNLVLILLIYAILVGIVTFGVPQLLKAIFHRPRYRLLVLDSSVSFHNWWQPFKGYKDYLAAHGNDIKEEFKSFPSGHVSAMAGLPLGAAMLPLVDKRLRKFQLPVFIVTAALTLLVAFCRMLCAAHFLSDVSMALFIVMLFGFIANEVLIRVERFHPEDAEGTATPVK